MCASYTKEIGAFGNASFRVMENGPVRATVRVRTSYGDSNMTGLDALRWRAHRRIECLAGLARAPEDPEVLVPSGCGESRAHL